jgi:hypothetical protein
MHITEIGYILISICFILFCIAPSYLYVLMVFFIPFSATAIINFDVSSSSSGLPAYLFIGSVWMSSLVLRIASTGNIAIPRESRIPLALLMVFIGTTILSLFMPVYINGSLSVKSPVLFDNKETPVIFTMKHVTQILYLLFGGLFTVFAVKKNSTYDQLLSSIRIYVLSSFFVSLWGIMQFILNMLNIPYPYSVFNNSVTTSAQGFNQQLRDLAIQRVSSVAVEPSILAQYLLTVVPLLFFSIFYRTPVITASFDRICLVLVICVLFVSTASTAYYGLLITWIMIFVMLYFMRQLRLRHLIYNLGLLISLIISLVIVPGILALLNELLIAKTTSYSGMERLQSISVAWGYFLQYPLLGIGWGSVSSHDLVVKILSNAGMLGIIAFGAFFLYVVSRHLAGLESFSHEKTFNEIQHLNSALFVSIAVLLINNMLTGFAFMFGHVWFITALSIAVTGLMRRRKPRNSSGTGE